MFLWKKIGTRRANHTIYVISIGYSNHFREAICERQGSPLITLVFYKVAGTKREGDKSDAVLLSFMPKGGLINAEDIGSFLKRLR
jgi:hypothetical protein